MSSAALKQLEYAAGVIAPHEGITLRGPVLDRFVYKLLDSHVPGTNQYAAFFIEPISGPAPNRPVPIIIGRAYITIWGTQWHAEGRNGWEEIAEKLNNEWSDAYTIQRLRRKAYGYIALLLAGFGLIAQAICANGGC